MGDRRGRGMKERRSGGKGGEQGRGDQARRGGGVAAAAGRGAEGGGCVRAGHMVAAALPISRPRCRGALAAGSRRAAAFVVRDPARSAARRPPLSLTAALCPAVGPGRPARPAHEGAPRPPLPPARGGAALRRWRRCPLCGKLTASAPSPRAPWR